MKKVNNVEFFTAKEILKSETADKLNIDNYPKDETIIDNINYTLCRLDEIRIGYGEPIYITSGYRCDELNKAVHGVSDSKHREGLAVDLQWDEDLFDYLVMECSFDKLIRECKKGKLWIHLQFKRDEEKERCRVILFEC